MRKRLFETCDITHLDLNLLLDAKQDLYVEVTGNGLIRRA